MKPLFLLALIVLLVSAFSLPKAFVYYKVQNTASGEDVYFGVTFGSNSTEEAKLLIDKVKEYTNLFIVDSWPISTNETALNEVCNYAVNANLSLIVFFDFISYRGYPWLHEWLDTARERWGSKFLGIYLYDEPGGRQIDKRQWDEGTSLRKLFANVSDYSDAANKFVTSIPSSFSMQNVKNSSLSVFTSDYALFWFDYLAGYDTVFTELGWNHSDVQQIALARGAAKVQGKQWGAIITWTFQSPPYLDSGEEILQDMKTAYRAGAQYVIVFNHPTINPYGVLTEEHFNAMKAFWNHIHNFPRSIFGQTNGQVAFVLPKDYGWGMRNPEDKIWGIWPSDDLSPVIWEKMTSLITRYGLSLDIVYDDPQFDLAQKYSLIYFWE